MTKIKGAFHLRGPASQSSACNVNSVCNLRAKNFKILHILKVVHVCTILQEFKRLAYKPVLQNDTCKVTGLAIHFCQVKSTSSWRAWYVVYSSCFCDTLITCLENKRNNSSFTWVGSGFRQECIYTCRVPLGCWFVWINKIQFCCNDKIQCYSIFWTSISPTSCFPFVWEFKTVEIYCMVNIYIDWLVLLISSSWQIQ